MQVRVSAEMLDALRHTAEIPDSLLACVENAKADGQGFLVSMSQDEAMAMGEMCQWYIRRDPTSGRMEAKAALFDAILRAIYQAEEG